MKFFGLIVARSGSKGIPDKNILPFRNKPLVQVVSEILVASHQMTEVAISTDSFRYGKLAAEVGVKFGWLRPASLACDNTSITDVIQHAIDAEKLLERGFTHIVLVQPSSPLVCEDDIREAVSLIKTGKFDSVVSAVKYDDHMAHYLFIEENGYCDWLMGKDSFGNRQQLPSVYKRCGNVYCFDIRKFITIGEITCDRCGYILVPQNRSLCLDTKDDLITLKKLEELQNGG